MDLYKRSYWGWSDQGGLCRGDGICFKGGFPHEKEDWGIFEEQCLQGNSGQ